MAGHAGTCCAHHTHGLGLLHNRWVSALPQPTLRLLCHRNDKLIPFSDEAKRQFERVAEKYRFECVAADERRVRYESTDVFLDVRFDNGRSYDLGIEIGQIIPNKIERPFSLAEILRLKNVSEGRSIDGFSASSVTKLRDGLKTLADLTLNYADDFLRGRVSSFVQVPDLREKESLDYAIQRDLRTARAKAVKAWNTKDYAGVIAAYEPVKSHLEPSEVKRLQYSQSKIFPVSGS